MNISPNASKHRGAPDYGNTERIVCHQCNELWPCEVERLASEVERLTLADRQWADHVKRLSEENERLHGSSGTLTQRLEFAQDEIERLTNAEGAFLAEVARLRASLAEITDLELEGDASLADAMHIADEALNPPA